MMVHSNKNNLHDRNFFHWRGSRQNLYPSEMTTQHTNQGNPCTKTSGITDLKIYTEYELYYSQNMTNLIQDSTQLHLCV